MLFREKMYLANCDSTRRLEPAELRKRMLLGLVFADGVLLTPNILLDNQGFDSLLAERSVIKYLNEEGLGKFVIRGFNLHGLSSMSDYYEKLPSSYVLSSLPGSPTKGDLGATEEREFRDRLRRLDQVLHRFQPVFESVEGSKSLTSEVHRRVLQEPAELWREGEREQFIEGTRQLISRSEWYRYSEALFASDPERSERIRRTLLDPAYNSLFVSEQEVFAQDRIRYLGGLPERLLLPGVAIRALRRELGMLEGALRLFEVVASAGSGELLRFLADEALGYIEDKAQEQGVEFLSRRNWFGLYPWLQRKIGIEVG